MNVRDKVFLFFARGYNFLFVAAEISLFLLAISTLLGWWLIGLGSCLLLIARVVDFWGSYRNIVLYKGSGSTYSRKHALFFLAMVAIAILINFGFFVAYFLGIEVPYDADPMHLPSATWIRRE